MNLAASMEKLLRCWAQYRNMQHADLAVNSGTGMEIIDGISVPPDGGMGDFVDDHVRLFRLESAARSIQETLPYMPTELREVFYATYVGEDHQLPRSERQAAERMGVSLTKYQRLKFGMLMWFKGVYFKTEAARPHGELIDA